MTSEGRVLPSDGDADLPARPIIAEHFGEDTAERLCGPESGRTHSPDDPYACVVCRVTGLNAEDFAGPCANGAEKHVIVRLAGSDA